ncbi:E3 ubiquitin-protein ligase UHRF1 [Echria macrotheca]|uniref:E3 ubiquitin-protein ligase UHRF1 n=1 Tax=Echria macrotheca TaxID=438768 RepID=A0AAJ0BKX9_9PEZI|nr:E3 ubiquitin-protein ligase UHRF1 [Echria macrotheca]
MSATTAADNWARPLDAGATEMGQLFTNVKNRDRPGGRPSAAEMERRTSSVRAFLAHLENLNLEEVLSRPTVEKALGIFTTAASKGVQLPEDLVTTAAQLYNRLQAHKAAAALASPSSEEGDEAVTPPPTTNAPVAPGITTNNGVIKLPPLGHPSWGLNGIMHGLALSRRRDGHWTITLDPRFEGEKRNFRVIGHNGLEPGDWWPNQRLALFHGAHGHPVSGISGSSQTGAYSIVVSGRSVYHETDMDRDHGNVILYSADNSVDNRNPDQVLYTTERTRALQKSLRQRLPVRVLRSAGPGSSIHKPQVGIRYDGLYSVVSEQTVQNQHGGRYFQFRLQRRSNQPSLEDVRESPSRAQIRAYHRVYTSHLSLRPTDF